MRTTKRVQEEEKALEFYKILQGSRQLGTTKARMYLGVLSTNTRTFSLVEFRDPAHPTGRCCSIANVCNINKREEDNLLKVTTDLGEEYIFYRINIDNLKFYEPDWDEIVPTPEDDPNKIIQFK